MNHGSVHRSLAYLTFVLFAAAHPVPASGQEPGAADLLPSSIVIYTEITRPQVLTDLLIDSPIARRIREAPEYQQALQTPQYRKLADFVDYVETELETDWQTALRTLTAGGVYSGIDAATRGYVSLIKSDDPAMLERYRDAMVKLIRQTAAAEGRADELKSSEYKGVTAWQTNQGVMATAGPWLILATNGDLAKRIIDNMSADGGLRLSDDEVFKKARAAASPDLAGWTYARIGILRYAGVAGAIFSARSQNPLAELLFGGVLAAAAQAEYATAELTADPTHLRLNVLLPFEAAQVSPFRRFFFSDQLDEAAPTPLIPEGTIASFSTYRDLAAIWKAAPDLFTENIATQFAQAESQLSNFFGGRSFGVDVLGGLTPRFQFLIVRRQFDEADSPVPKIKLPAAALVMRARNAKLMTPVMQLGFQTIVGIVNIQAAMGGQPALILTNESLESGMLATAAYIPPPDGTSNDGALIHNFSPSMAIVGDYVILTTARPLAEQLIALASATREPTTIRENTLLQIDAPAAVAALRDNRETLIAQNMIQQGASREQSERAIDVLLELLTFVRNVDAKILTTPQTFRIELGAQFQGE